jgi:hypothetical protein
MKPFLLLIVSAAFCHALSEDRVMLELDAAPSRNIFGSERTSPTGNPVPAITRPCFSSWFF